MYNNNIYCSKIIRFLESNEFAIDLRNQFINSESYCEIFLHSTINAISSSRGGSCSITST